MLCGWSPVTPSLSLTAGDNLMSLKHLQGRCIPSLLDSRLVPLFFSSSLNVGLVGLFVFPLRPALQRSPHPPCWSPAWPTVPFLCWREKGFPSSRQMWPQDTQLDELNVARDQLPFSLTPFPSPAPLPTARTPQPGRARMVAPSKRATFRLLQ